MRLPRVRFTVGRSMLLVALFAVSLGGYLEYARREARRARWPYELEDAAEAGDLPRIRSLLAEGANVNSVHDGRYPATPLMKAAYAGQADAMKLLLESGADPNHEDLDFYSSITMAADQGRWDIVRLLAEHGADPAKRGGESRSPLDYAKEQGNAEMIRYLESRSPK
jgi:ankyrin repeat protein